MQLFTLWSNPNTDRHGISKGIQVNPNVVDDRKNPGQKCTLHNLQLGGWGSRFRGQGNESTRSYIVGVPGLEVEQAERFNRAITLLHEAELVERNGQKPMLVPVNKSKLGRRGILLLVRYRCSFDGTETFALPYGPGARCLAEEITHELKFDDTTGDKIRDQKYHDGLWLLSPGGVLVLQTESRDGRNLQIEKLAAEYNGNDVQLTLLEQYESMRAELAQQAAQAAEAAKANVVSVPAATVPSAPTTAPVVTETSAPSDAGDEGAVNEPLTAEEETLGDSLVAALTSPADTASASLTDTAPTTTTAPPASKKSARKQKGPKKPKTEVAGPKKVVALTLGGAAVPVVTTDTEAGDSSEAPATDEDAA